MRFLFLISVQSRGRLSLQLLSTVDTLSIGKGRWQQWWHSGVALESTVLGTRLLTTSFPTVTSCWWGGTILPHHSVPYVDRSGPTGSSDQRRWTNRGSSERGSGYRLPHKEASNGHAPETRHSLRVQAPIGLENKWDWTELNGPTYACMLCLFSWKCDDDVPTIASTLVQWTYLLNVTMLLYNLSHWKWHFRKLFPKHEAKAHNSILPRFGVKRHTSFSFVLWLRVSENVTSDGIGCTCAFPNHFLSFFNLILLQNILTLHAMKCELIPRCGAPTPLLPYFLCVRVVLLVSSVRVLHMPWSLSI